MNAIGIAKSIFVLLSLLYSPVCLAEKVSHTVSLPFGSKDFRLIKAFSNKQGDIVVEYALTAKDGFDEVRFYDLSGLADIEVGQEKTLYMSSEKLHRVEAESGWKKLSSIIFGKIELDDGYSIRGDMLLTGSDCWWPYRQLLTVLRDGEVVSQYFVIASAALHTIQKQIDCESVQGQFTLHLRSFDPGLLVFKAPRKGFLMGFQSMNCLVEFKSFIDLKSGKICDGVAVMSSASMIAPYGEMATGTISPQEAISQVDVIVGRLVSANGGL